MLFGSPTTPSDVVTTQLSVLAAAAQPACPIRWWFLTRGGWCAGWQCAVPDSKVKSLSFHTVLGRSEPNLEVRVKSERWWW